MMMKVCIVGAGAIGGFIGTRLALAGQATVSALARGATLDALRTHGWRLRMNGELLTAPASASGPATSRWTSIAWTRPSRPAPARRSPAA